MGMFDSNAVVEHNISYVPLYQVAESVEEILQETKFSSALPAKVSPHSLKLRHLLSPRLKILALRL